MRSPCIWVGAQAVLSKSLCLQCAKVAPCLIHPCQAGSPLLPGTMSGCIDCLFSDYQRASGQIRSMRWVGDAHMAHETACAVVSMPATTTPAACVISFSLHHSLPAQPQNPTSPTGLALLQLHNHNVERGQLDHALPASVSPYGYKEDFACMFLLLFLWLPGSLWMF